MLNICYKRQEILKRINNLSNQTDISLLAVSKTFPLESILALIHDGQLDFAESYLQEAMHKINALSQLNIVNVNQVKWHFIGSIQSNKTADIAANFAWVHSIDRLKIAQRLNEQRGQYLDKLGKLNICLQVNIDNSSTKSGIKYDEVISLAQQILLLKNLVLRGLMAIPNDINIERSFESMQKLFRIFKEYFNNDNIDTLCMGMSNDYQLAIKYGANMLRVGSAIFGERNNKI